MPREPSWEALRRCEMPWLLQQLPDRTEAAPTGGTTSRRHSLGEGTWNVCSSQEPAGIPRSSLTQSSRPPLGQGIRAVSEPETQGRRHRARDHSGRGGCTGHASLSYPPSLPHTRRGTCLLFPGPEMLRVVFLSANSLRITRYKTM